VHTTPEQCLVSISTIAHQAQGIRAGEVIAKLAEDTYFMRVDNRVTQAPPPRTREHENHEATSRSPADNGRNRTRGELVRTSLLWIQQMILRWSCKVQSLELEHDN
jgi:hypothetical protein